MKKELIILITISLFVLTSCSVDKPDVQAVTIEYHAESMSSGGNRILNISYQVQDGQITSCEGTYFFPGEGPERIQQTEKCDINKLKNKEYNVPLELITDYESAEQSGEVNNGRDKYSWKIIYFGDD